MEDFIRDFLLDVLLILIGKLVDTVYDGKDRR